MKDQHARDLIEYITSSILHIQDNSATKRELFELANILGYERVTQPAPEVFWKKRDKD